MPTFATPRRTRGNWKTASYRLVEEPRAAAAGTVDNKQGRIYRLSRDSTGFSRSVKWGLPGVAEAGFGGTIAVSGSLAVIGLTNLDYEEGGVAFFTRRPSGHNQYIVGNTLYQANYMSGLRVLDITDRLHPVEIGYFDTHPTGPDEPGFLGAWGNYPFFKSGVVAVSSMGEGVFILKKRATPPVP